MLVRVTLWENVFEPGGHREKTVEIEMSDGEFAALHTHSVPGCLLRAWEKVADGSYNQMPTDEPARSGGDALRTSEGIGGATSGEPTP